MLKTLDETVTSFPRIWSRADDGTGAVLQQEDLTKAAGGKSKLASYPSLGIARVRFAGRISSSLMREGKLAYASRRSHARYGTFCDHQY